MAEGDTNLTNLVLSGDSTTGGNLAVTGTTALTGNVTATGELTASKLYGPTISASNPTVAGFVVDGTNPPMMSYIRVYDTGYNAFRNYRFWNGKITAV